MTSPEADRIRELETALTDLVALVLRTGGYMTPEDQNVLWRARQALLGPLPVQAPPEPGEQP